MKHDVGYEEGMQDAMLLAKIVYIAKTKQPNGCCGKYIAELEAYKNDFDGLKKFLKRIGFRIVSTYTMDDGRWLLLNKDIRVSEDGFVSSYKPYRERK